MLVSAGGTREELDPVRFLGNWSSGRQGYALARTAAGRGAKVTLVAANVALDDPAGAQVVRVTSARELRDAVTVGRVRGGRRGHGRRRRRLPARRPGARRRSRSRARPRSRSAWSQNPDILRELSGHRARPGQVVVGFAAETGDVLANGRRKLAAKGCDLLVVNQVGGGLAFGTADNEAVVLAADGARTAGAARAQGSAGRRDLGPGRRPPELASRSAVLRAARRPARLHFGETSSRNSRKE